MSRKISRLFLVAGFLLSSLPAGAAIVQYNDQASWLAAIGGSPTNTEDFSSFSSDTQFRTSPVALTVGSLQQSGLDQAFRNNVDVPPLVYTDNNGTSHASSYVNWPDSGPGSETWVVLTVPVDVGAAGFNVYGCLGLELLAVDLLDGSNNVIGTLLPAATDTFLGFVGDAGEVAAALRFRSQTQSAGTGGEGFGLDDISTVEGPVPVELMEFSVE